MSAIFFTDGSKFNSNVGWAFIAHHDDTSVECVGQVKTGAHIHEQIAFIEAYLYAKAHNFELKNVAFYTDDDVIAHAAYLLHPENYVPNGKLQVLTKFKHVLEQHYSHVTMAEILEALTTARFHKVKGHSKCIYNFRVDYLAKREMKKLLKVPNQQALEFHRWLHDFDKSISEDVPNWDTNLSHIPFARETEVV
jgi:ribonuclease HI